VFAEPPVVTAVARAAGPWIDAVALGAPLLGPAAGWEWDGARPVDVLRSLARNDEARQALAEATASLHAAGLAVAAVAGTASRVFNDLGTALGRLSGVVGERALAAARAAAALWADSWSRAGDVVGGLLPGGRISGFLAGQAVATATAVIRRAWEAGRLPGAPPPVPTVIQIMRQEDSTEVARASALLQARAAEPLKTGAVTEPPPALTTIDPNEVETALRVWAEAASQREQADRWDVAGPVHAFLTSYERGRREAVSR